MRFRTAQEIVDMMSKEDQERMRLLREHGAAHRAEWAREMARLERARQTVMERRQTPDGGARMLGA